MNKNISKALCSILFFVLMFVNQIQAQEINAKVVIEYRQIQGTNVSVFKTLETTLTEFINGQRWTNDEYQSNERLECNFILNISATTGNSYSGSLTVSARRPIYNASISTTLINVVDNDFSFTYNEFDQLVFNKNSLTQDLTAVLGFYIYTILGIDGDSFSEYGGDTYYNDAIGIVSTAQGSTTLNTSGWNRLDSKRNRHVLISELLSSEFRPFRSYLYKYHRQGLDVMADNSKQGADVILEGINSLKSVASTSPASYTMLLFFDVKTDEIQNIIREMDTSDEAVAKQKKELIADLKKIDPSRVKMYDALLK